jgi:hypothetical protein
MLVLRDGDGEGGGGTGAATPEDTGAGHVTREALAFAASIVVDALVLLCSASFHLHRLYVQTENLALPCVIIRICTVLASRGRCQIEWNCRSRG